MSRYILRFIASGLMISAIVWLGACSRDSAKQTEQAASQEPAVDQPMEQELPVTRIPGLGEAAEAYFSPDGQSLICNAKLEGDETHQVYTVRIDGSEVRRINDRGADACSFYFPDGKRLVWTSTRDLTDLHPGSFSDPEDYPTGSELYTSDLEGGNVVRLTDNQLYEAEVSVSPDGEWILFTRDIDGELDLWRMRPDGSDEEQITFTPEQQEGGSFYLPDGETILYRAWLRSDQGVRGMPMTIYTIKHDGTEKTQITHESGTNWAPYPTPDGRSFAFVKMLPPHNFDIFMMNMETGEQRRLTFGEGFDGFPAISPDGQTMAFSSSREAAEGERSLHLYTMDISSLGLGGPAEQDGE